MLSLRSYAILSFLATVACIVHAVQLRKQFYSIVIHLATSKLSVTIIGNMAFVSAFMFAQLMRQIFLGSLRAAELDRLYERIWFAVTETCLALTIFREELKFRFVFLFTLLLFVKAFHWLSQFRVDQLHTEIAVTVISHVRILSLMGLLFAVDCFFVIWQAKTLLLEGPSFLLLFAFEYVILVSDVISTFFKYILYVIDIRRHGRWTSKAVYLFYLNLITDLFQLFVYLIFFSIVLSYYGVPLHIIREVYSKFGNFKKRLSDYFRYRRVIVNMNTRFPTPTAEELARMDRTCIICREEMDHEHSKKLPCGHIFHFDCLRSWLEEHTTCPICRSPVEADPVTPALQPPAAEQPAQPAAPAPAAQTPAAPPAQATDASAAAAASAAAPTPASTPAVQAPSPVPLPSPLASAAAAGDLASRPLFPSLPTPPPAAAASSTPQADAASAAAAAAAAAATAHMRSMGMIPPPPLQLPGGGNSVPDGGMSPGIAPPLGGLMGPGPMGPLSGPAMLPMGMMTPPVRSASFGSSSLVTEAAALTPSSSVGGGQASRLVPPEVQSLEPMQQMTAAQVEKVTLELDEILSGAVTLTGAEKATKLSGLKMQIQHLLLPMVSSQCTYLASVMQAGPEGGSSAMRRLKLQHMQRALEGKQRELRDIINLCNEGIEGHAAASAEEGAGTEEAGEGLHRRKTATRQDSGGSM